MCELFDKVKLGELFEIVKGSVCPYLFPKEKFTHHSLPAFDELGGPVIESGQSIESNKTLLSDSAILLSKLNPRISRVSIAEPISGEPRHCCSTEFIVYRPRHPKISLEFYKNIFQSASFRSSLQIVATGTTNSHVRVPPTETLGWEVPNPTFPEQVKIAEVLSKVDQAIGQTASLIAKQQRIKTGLMQDLLTRGIDEHGNLRSEETHEFKDSPSGRIPVEWNYVSLGAHLRNIEQGWSPDCDTVPAVQGQWGVLKTTSVVWEGFQCQENKVLPDSLKPKPQYEVRNGDVLMTRGGPNSRVGVVVFVYETQSNLMLSDKLYRLIFDDFVCPEFIALALSSSATQRHLSTLKTGLAESQTNISQEIVKQLHILLPQKKEQEQIAKMLRDTSNYSHACQESLNKLHSLKTALRQDLLNGKKRVTPLMENMEVCS